MASERFKLTVKSGVEYHPMEQLDHYELEARIHTLREWFGLVSENFEIEAQVATPTEETS